LIFTHQIRGIYHSFLTHFDFTETESNNRRKMLEFLIFNSIL